MDSDNFAPKTILITGASDGIGKAAARELKLLGHNVVIVGRSPDKTKALGVELDVPFFTADFSKLSEVRSLGVALASAYPTIDVLLNNAGGLFDQYELTEDGLEKTMQVNHFAHFLLTNVLMDTLVSSKATIINTSSIAHKVLSRFDANDINMKHAYTKYRAYGNAKLANVMFTKELDRRYKDSGIHTAAFHPGYVATNFASSSSGLLHAVYRSPLRRLFGFVTPEQGADTAVWLATSSPQTDWESGEYYVKRTVAKSHRSVNDASLTRSLWEQSEQLTHCSYKTYE